MFIRKLEPANFIETVIWRRLTKHFFNPWNASLETGTKAICLYKFWLLKFNQNLLIVEDVGNGMIPSLIRNSVVMTVNKKTRCEYKPRISSIWCEVQILTPFSYEIYCLYVCNNVWFGRYVSRVWNNTLPTWGWR